MTARCRRPECGRPLHTEESKARGYGPVCWRRMHPSVVVTRPVAGDDPDQIPLPLEATVDLPVSEWEYDADTLLRVLRMVGVKDLDDAVSALRETCDDCSAGPGQLCDRGCNCLPCGAGTVPQKSIEAS